MSEVVEEIEGDTEEATLTTMYIGLLSIRILGLGTREVGKKNKTQTLLNLIICAFHQMMDFGEPLNVRCFVWDIVDFRPEMKALEVEIISHNSTD